MSKMPTAMSMNNNNNNNNTIFPFISVVPSGKLT